MGKQRKKIPSRQRGDKRFEGKGEAKVLQGGQIEQWRYTSWRSPRRESQCYLQKEQGLSRGKL